MKLTDIMVLSHTEKVMSSPGDWFGRGEMDRYKTKKLKSREIREIFRNEART